MNDEQIMADAWSGKFGYDVIDHKMCIPYIYRGDEKVCATKIFQWHVDQLNIKLNPVLAEFKYLMGYDMSLNDAILYNEINQWHNDTMYPYIFRLSDTLVKLNDVREIWKFVQDCDKKSKLGERYEMDAGLIQIQWKTPHGIGEESMYTVWPYILKDKKRYVPITFLADSSSTLSATIVLDGIDVMYMRFLYTALKCDIPKKDFEIPCADLDDALSQILCATDMVFEFDENYWPTKKRQPPKTLPLPVLLGSHIKKLNNNNLAFFTQTPTQPQTTVSPVKTATDVMTTTAVKPVEVTSSKDVDDNKDTNAEEKNQKISSRKRQNEKGSSHKEKTSSSSSKKVASSAHFYEVQHLIEFKMVKGKEMVLVRWKGYTSADDSWEPVSNMNDKLEDDVDELREKYLEKTGRKKRHYH